MFRSPTKIVGNPSAIGPATASRCGCSHASFPCSSASTSASDPPWSIAYIPLGHHGVWVWAIAATAPSASTTYAQAPSGIRPPGVPGARLPSGWTIGNRLTTCIRGEAYQPSRRAIFRVFPKASCNPTTSASATRIAFTTARIVE